MLGAFRYAALLALAFCCATASLAQTNHWAYRPVTISALHPVQDRSWPETTIDEFVLAKLEEKGLAPTRDADRPTLARRLYFDLHGLPPTAEQLAAFETNHSPHAIEQLVDELLASPRFGERWARHWLDVARFGESVTLRGFIYREAWRYRDYVIDSFNRDLPYDRFVREQIAGDLLPADSLAERQRQHIATTFLALGNTNFEEQDKKQLEMDVVDEQLDTIGKAFLAQTIGCARCHDHKFDPIPTRDYYAMAGILKNARLLEHANVSKWIEVPLPLHAAEEAHYADHDAKIAALESKLKKAKDDLKRLTASSEPNHKGEAIKPSVVAVSQLAGTVVDSAQAKAVGEWKHSQYSKHYIGDGYLHDLDQAKGEKTLTFMPELPRAGRYEVRFAYIHAPSRSAAVPVTVFHADGETALHVNQQEAPIIDGRFVSLGQFRFEANNFSYVLVSTEGTKGFVTADAVQFLPADAVEVAAARNADTPRGVPPSARNADTPVRASAEHADKSVRVTGTTDLSSEIKWLEKELKQLRESGPKRPMIMSVKEEAEIKDLHVQIRGSVHRLGEKAPRGFLTAAAAAPAPTIPASQSGRRELADWLASPSNPLTARVMVNRVWHWLFGTGLVRTTDNFGTTGETPSHPKLLDYLATRFVDQGWSVKKLIREIVLSRTYQLANGSPARVASDPSGGNALDPDNRYLWRANRQRLEAECLRDAILAVSGQLVLVEGGPTIPPQLASDYGFRHKDPRRSIYVPVLRNALPELFEMFDFADPSVTTGERNVSTVAPQALYLMNHPFVMEQAAHAARRTLARSFADDVSRIQWAYATTLGRKPTSSELDIMQRHLAAQVGRGVPAEPRLTGDGSPYLSTEAEEKWTSLYHARFASVDFRYVN
jgi:hypothetical protein